MKKMWPVFLALCVTLLMFCVVGSTATAQNQCEIVGNSYTITVDCDEWTLTDFTNVPGFSPAPPCGGNVSLVSPDGEYSYHKWCVSGNGLTVAGFPALLTESGLNIYCVPMDLYILHIGNTIYMTEQEVPLLLFK